MSSFLSGIVDGAQPQKPTTDPRAALTHIGGSVLLAPKGFTDEVNSKILEKRSDDKKTLTEKKTKSDGLSPKGTI